MVQVLCDGDVFSSYVTVIVPLPEDDAGLTVTQEHDSDTDHETLEETVMG